ncbi:MAG: type VI secretion system contractile sheath large subunit [Planctomycetota bacterium]
MPAVGGASLSAGPGDGSAWRKPVEWTLGESSGASPTAARLRAATSHAEALAAWASARVPAGEQLCRQTVSDRLAADIALLDDVLGRQLDAILHHPRFQQLEASWRSLLWLVERADEAAGGGTDDRARVRVRFLSASKRELARDRTGAIEFDRSALWRKVYEDEFGTPGGTPYGLLIADYAFGRHPEDLELLTGLGEIAAASFAPLVAAPQPDLLGIDSFQHLEEVPAIDVLHAGAEYTKWRSLRDREESRFLGLALPRVLARLPYDGWIGEPDGRAANERTWAHRGFRYRERVDGPDSRRRLWTSAAWAFAGVVIAEFGRSGWFADIRGGSRGAAGGGLVEALPVETFGPSEPVAFRRGPTETTVTEAAERRLAAAGFLPLVATGADGRAVFHSNQSLHLARRYDRAEATANARVSAMLQYMLCVSRFAHYLKVLGRDKVGSVASADDLEHVLNEWVHDYVTPDDRASAETRASLPLRAAQVEVRDEPGTAGGYRVVMHLQPHFQLDELATSVRLTTSIRKK